MSAKQVLNKVKMTAAELKGKILGQDESLIWIITDYLSSSNKLFTLSEFLLIRRIPVPPFEVILVRIDFLSFDCFSYFIHILNFSTNFDFSFLLYFSHGISPRTWYFPKLNQLKFTLVLLPRLAVIIRFFCLIYIHFDIYILSKAFNMTKLK